MAALAALALALAEARGLPPPGQARRGVGGLPRAWPAIGPVLTLLLVPASRDNSLVADGNFKTKGSARAGGSRRVKVAIRHRMLLGEHARKQRDDRPKLNTRKLEDF